MSLTEVTTKTVAAASTAASNAVNAVLDRTSPKTGSIADGILLTGSAERVALKTGKDAGVLTRASVGSLSVADRASSAVASGLNHVTKAGRSLIDIMISSVATALSLLVKGIALAVGVAAIPLFAVKEAVSPSLKGKEVKALVEEKPAAKAPVAETPKTATLASKAKALLDKAVSYLPKSTTGRVALGLGVVTVLGLATMSRALSGIGNGVKMAGDIVLHNEIEADRAAAVAHQEHMFKMDSLELKAELEEKLGPLVNYPFGGYFDVAGARKAELLAISAAEKAGRKAELLAISAQDIAEETAMGMGKAILLAEKDTAKETAESVARLMGETMQLELAETSVPSEDAKEVASALRQAFQEEVTDVQGPVLDRVTRLGVLRSVEDSTKAMRAQAVTAEIESNANTGMGFDPEKVEQEMEAAALARFLELI